MKPQCFSLIFGLALTTACGPRPVKIPAEKADGIALVQAEWESQGRPCGDEPDRFGTFVRLLNELRTAGGLSPVLCLPSAATATVPPFYRRQQLLPPADSTGMAPVAPVDLLRAQLRDLRGRALLLTPGLRFFGGKDGQFVGFISVPQQVPEDPGEPAFFPTAEFDGFVPLEYPISVHFHRYLRRGGLEPELKTSDFTLREVEENLPGRRIAVRVWRAPHHPQLTRGHFVIVPKAPLKSGKRYLVSVEARYGDQVFNRDWSFVTAEEKGSVPSPQPEPVPQPFADPVMPFAL